MGSSAACGQGKSHITFTTWGRDVEFHNPHLHKLIQEMRTQGTHTHRDISDNLLTLSHADISDDLSFYKQE